MNPKMKSAIEKITLNDATFSNEVIEPTYVNFFYGKNGAGKSTIARTFKANDERLQWQAGKASTDYDVLVYDTDFINANLRNYGNLAGVFTVNETPVALFTPVDIKTCNTDTTVTFNVAVNYAGTDPVNFEWFVNDISSGNSNPFTYQFQAPGGVTAVNVFNIRVLVKNSVGCGDTVNFGKFTIQTLGPRDIVVSPSFVQSLPNTTFTFSDTAQNLPSMTYLWFTGDRNNTEIPGREITYTYGDTGIYHVRLTVTDYETGCLSTDSVKVYVLSVPGYLYVPNAFCPGCRKIELRQFLPLGKGLKDYYLVIYNTWGQKVFETRSLDANGIPNQPWTGNWKTGENVQQGAFSWHIEAHYINGAEWKGMLNPKSNRLEKQGFISVIR